MKKYGFSFSWKRLLGISGLKTKVSRKTGVPLTKGGFERKVGRTLIKTIENFINGKNKVSKNKTDIYSDRDRLNR